jgi:hypothetical protein
VSLLLGKKIARQPRFKSIGEAEQWLVDHDLRDNVRS